MTIRAALSTVLALSWLLIGGCKIALEAGAPDGSMTPGVDAGGADALAPPDDALAPPDDANPPPPDLSAVILTVTAPANLLELDSCQVTPAELPAIPAGSYAITLESSTLSKGGVSGSSPPLPSVDNYVIVQLPMGAGDPQQARRFFMLNGIGASATFTLAAPGVIQVMFIDSDDESNAGEATVSVTPGAYQATVSAVANVLRWRQGCNSTPALLDVSARSHDVTLRASTLSPAAGQPGDYVLLRLPSELQQDDHRYVILNGIDASQLFEASDSSPLRAWFISPGAGATGQATLEVSDP